MSSEASDFLTKKFPYELHQVIGPNNELVWVERGVNPDNIFDDKRKTDWPFSEVIADLICSQVAEGSSLSKVCKQPGFPSYNVICRWRIENPTFAESLKLAYQDRADFYFDRVLEVVESDDLKDNLLVAKAKIEAYKWASEANRPKIKAIQALYNILIAT